jgi:hypothetical protein
MRKIAAILLLSIFTFNILGYQLVYNFFSQQSDVALELALDQDKYNDSQLISIKQPTNLPYYTNSKSFSRIDGEVEIDGTTYKYVKCRIYNDSLEMLCIPHVEKMKIQQSKQDYAKIANDFQQDSNKKKTDNNSKSFQKQLSEYEELQNEFTDNNYVTLNSNFAALNIPFVNKHFFNTVEQPPDAPFVA